MIRCIFGKSSVCYPEVVHRFCGYLVSRDNANDDRVAERCQHLRDHGDHDFLSAICVVAPRSKFEIRDSLDARQTESRSRSRSKLLRSTSAAHVSAERGVAITHQSGDASRTHCLLDSRPQSGPVAQRLVQGTHRTRKSHVAFWRRSESRFRAA
jgi:hypothetical protein